MDSGGDTDSGGDLLPHGSGESWHGDATSDPALPPPTSARTAAKPRTREVAARYMQQQPKATPAALPRGGGQPSLTGRASLAAYGSQGWVELQHPQHAATPLMVPGGSLGGGPGMLTHARTGGARARTGGGQPTPASAALAQQQQQHLVTPAPDARSGPMRTPCGVPHGMSASVAAAPRPPVHAGGAMGRQAAQSADLAAVVAAQQQATQPRTDTDRRAQLEAWRRQQQQGGRTAAKPGTFKEPAPKPTLFRATAATRISKEAPVPGTGSSTQRRTPAAAVAPATAAPAVPAAAPSDAVDITPDRRASQSGASPSAFTGTMAALQQSSGGKQRPGKQGSAGKSGSSRPAGVPALHLEQALTPSRVPRLDLSAAAAHHQQQQQQPTAAADGSSGAPADAGTRDATPRTARDTPPSRLPRTPRLDGPPAGYHALPPPRSTPPPAAREASSGSDTSAVSSKPPLWQQQQQHLGSSGPAGSPAAAAGKLGVPRLKLAGIDGGSVPASSAGLASAGTAAAGSGMFGRAGGGSCLSARGAAKPPSGASTGRPVAPLSARGSPIRPALTPPSASKQQGRTPRGLHRLVTPRASAVGAPVAPAAAASTSAAAAPATARALDADTADDVRQQLRLLRMQQHQLQHLNARIEAAVGAKREKADAAIAAAAAAVVDLSGQLLHVRDQVQKHTWRGQLQEALQEQLSKLRAWSTAQSRHEHHVAELQGACSSALSHVPLLNGASVGHDPQQPDLHALQRQLQQGVALMDELQPAMQLLLTGDPAAAPGGSSDGASGPQPQPATTSSQAYPRGVKDTARLTEELMAVAAEECGLLQQLSHQLADLSDLHLYASSMQVQLLHMQHPRYQVHI